MVQSDGKLDASSQEQQRLLGELERRIIDKNNQISNANNERLLASISQSDGKIEASSQEQQRLLGELKKRITESRDKISSAKDERLLDMLKSNEKEEAASREQQRLLAELKVFINKNHKQIATGNNESLIARIKESDEKGKAASREQQHLLGELKELITQNKKQIDTGNRWVRTLGQEVTGFMGTLAIFFMNVATYKAVMDIRKSLPIPPKTSSYQEQRILEHGVEQDKPMNMLFSDTRSSTSSCHRFHSSSSKLQAGDGLW